MRNLILNRTREVFFHLKKYEKAKYYYNYVLNGKDFQNNWELTFSHAGLSQSYLAEGNYNKSIYHGKESLAYAKLINAKMGCGPGIEDNDRKFADSSMNMIS